MIPYVIVAIGLIGRPKGLRVLACDGGQRMPEPKVAEAVKSYEVLRPTYILFVDSLRALLLQLLSATDIDYVAIEGRTKTVESFQEKAVREGKEYLDPLHEMTDLAGIRIIAYHSRDLNDIAALLRENFDIDDAHSIDKTELLEPDRFGYLSRHYVVRLNGARRQLRENSAFADLMAEIQVRTVLQHAWAAIDHKLRYKTHADIPRPFRRRLFRVSALLETADDEFAALRAQVDELRDAYGKQVTKGNLELEVDADSLSAYVGASNVVRRLKQAAVEVGYNVIPPEPDKKAPEFTGLVDLLATSNISQIRDLDDLLTKFDLHAKARLAVVEKEWHKSDRVFKNMKLFVTSDSLLRIAVLLSLPKEVSSVIIRKQPFGAVLKTAMIAMLETPA